MRKEDEQYKDLCIAVCEQAVEDYRKALKSGTISTIRTFEKFFRSSWFTCLSQGIVDGQTVIEEVKRQWAAEKMLRRS